MAPYTHKNLRDVTNMAPQFGIEGGFEARFARADLEAERTGVTYQHLPPETQSPFGHRHQEAEEVYVVIRGSGRMRLGDEVIEVAEFDAIRVAPEVPRAFASGPEGLTVLAVGQHHDNDGEILQDFGLDD